MNPVGGLIGGNQAHAPVSTAGTGSGRGVVGTPLGQPGGRAARRANEQEMNHWDPDNPWATTEGVDPVLMPPREQRIDPGPAIGLT